MSQITKYIKESVEEAYNKANMLHLSHPKEGKLWVDSTEAKSFLESRLIGLIGVIKQEVEHLRPSLCKCDIDYECEHWGNHETVENVIGILSEAERDNK